MLWSKQCIRWPVSPDCIAGSGIDPLSSNTFFEIIRWQINIFQMIAGSSFLKRMWNKLCSWDAQLKCWFQTDLEVSDAKIQPAFTCGEGSRFWFFSPWSRVGHAVRPIFMLWLVKIWQMSSCGKCMQHGNLFSDGWSWQNFVSPTCHVFNCLFPLNVQNEYSRCQDSSVLHGWFVYWIYGWEIRR